jgi:3'(2'), 5'-bisphosphate nucleotidase
MGTLSKDQIEKVCWVLRTYGRQALSIAAEPFQIFEKGIEDYVTTVDRWLDEQLTREFKMLFPQDGLITEENSRSRQEFGVGHDRLWCIDPLDGTEDFIQKRSHYSVMAGVLEQGTPTAGWIYAPVFDHAYYGGSEYGLFQVNGDRPSEPLNLTEPAPPSSDFCPILIGSRDQREYGAALLQQIPGAQFSTLGSFGLKVMEVICGRAGIYIYFNQRVKVWDTAGPLALAYAAGLVCCDLDGNPLRFSADAMNLETLAHLQTIIIGWPAYVDALLHPLQQAVVRR